MFQPIGPISTTAKLSQGPSSGRQQQQQQQQQGRLGWGGCCHTGYAQQPGLDNGILRSLHGTVLYLGAPRHGNRHAQSATAAATERQRDMRTAPLSQQATKHTSTQAHTHTNTVAWQPCTLQRMTGCPPLPQEARKPCVVIAHFFDDGPKRGLDVTSGPVPFTAQRAPSTEHRAPGTGHRARQKQTVKRKRARTCVCVCVCVCLLMLLFSGRTLASYSCIHVHGADDAPVGLDVRVRG